MKIWMDYFCLPHVLNYIAASRLSNSKLTNVILSKLFLRRGKRISHYFGIMIQAFGLL